MSKKTKKQIEQYHNNIFIGNGLDGISGKSIGCRLNNNVYLEGAQKNKSQDSESIVDKVHTSFNFQKGSNPQTISFNAGEKLFSKEYPPITSEYIGKLPIPKMAMENPDGTPLDITTDYLGTPVNQKKVMPGPFQEIKSKENKFIVWPKKNSQKRKL